MKTKLLGSWLLCLLFVGCQDASPPATTDETLDDQAVRNSLSQPNVVVASWEETEQFIAQQKGKVVVLDVWSSWCIPCIQEFPYLVELHNKYPDQVACVSLNVDYAGLPDETPESHQEDVREFLTQQGATFHNVISSDPDSQIYETLELASVPAVYVYDRQGNLRHRFDNESAQGMGGFSYKEDIFPLVEQLVHEAPSPLDPGDPNKNQTYLWDAWNRLVEVKQGEEKLAGFAYDGLYRQTRFFANDNGDPPDVLGVLRQVQARTEADLQDLAIGAHQQLAAMRRHIRPIQREVAQAGKDRSRVKSHDSCQFGVPM